MSIDFKVNGCLIGHVYVVNKRTHYLMDNVDEYEYEFHLVGEIVDTKEGVKPKFKPLVSGELEHCQTDGFVILAQKILEDIVGQEK